MRSNTVFTTIIVILTILTLLSALTWAQGTEQPLYAFQGGPNDGANPFGRPIFDAAGNIYGTTLDGGITYGGGAAYQLTNNNGTWTETMIHSFGEPGDGLAVEAGLIIDAAGNLYGATCYGGVLGSGTIFELIPSNGSWTEQILYNFQGGTNDGSCPYLGQLTFDSAGNLYGTTKAGGPYNAGTFFELKPGRKHWNEEVLYSFTGGNDAYSPNESLVFDQAGNLYGASFQGGGSGCGGMGCGTVFQLSHTRTGWQEKVLYAFTGGKDGAWPYESVILDNAGNLYGTTFGGGDKKGHGVVFRLTLTRKGIWKEDVLYKFHGGDDGANPYVNVILGSDGALYGATDQAGAHRSGVLFKLTPAGGRWTQSVLYAFAGGTDGALPLSGLTFDQAGNIYGTTVEGGGATDCNSGCGTVYEFTP